jgi:glycosyltransferase involved in cell wall biosynthesis
VNAACAGRGDSDAADALDALVVVVPAHDEEELLPRCLAALGRALDRPRAEQPALAVSAVVVLDACSDSSAEIVSASGLSAVTVQHRAVGAARRDGVEHALAALPRAARETAAYRTWIATSDADSAVPPHWLTHQVALARRGADVVVGTVRPSLDDLSPDRARAWLRNHRPGAANGHVHGANLGARLSSYRAAGGFGPEPEHEDVTFVAAARAAGARVVATDASWVLTSGRLVGRTPGGYARHLRDDLLRSPG